MKGRFGERYGKWALVAGASEGLGASFSREAAARGLGVVLVARRTGPLESLAEEIRGTGDGGGKAAAEARCVVADLSRPDGVRAVIDATGDIEIGLLVCNAAYAPLGPFLDTRIEDHEKVVALNCAATLSLAHHMARRMRDRGRGGVVIMSSMSGFQGTALAGSYGASKAFGHVLAACMWEELRGSGVDVLACCAGPTRTPGWEASAPRRGGRFAPPPMEPGDVAREALDGLGSGPVVVPGAANRARAFLVRRLLPERVAVSLVGRTMRAIYG